MELIGLLEDVKRYILSYFGEYNKPHGWHVKELDLPKEKKIGFGVQYFENDDEQCITNLFKKMPADFYKDGIRKLLKWYKKYVTVLTFLVVYFM